MKTIWYKPINLEHLNESTKCSMSGVLDILFTESGDDYLKATMPVTDKTRQPLGFLHGGASVSLAETIASIASNCVLNFETHYCFGLEINANHIRKVASGQVTGVASPLHLGLTTHVWLINIFNEEEQLICTSRMTAAIMKRKL